MAIISFVIVSFCSGCYDKSVVYEELSNGFNIGKVKGSYDAVAMKQLTGDLLNISNLLSEEIVEQLTGATILITDSGTNIYIQKNSNDKNAGQIVIGDLIGYSKSVKQNQPMLIMNLLARYYYDSHINEAKQQEIISVFDIVKPLKYIDNYYSNGNKFEIVKKVPDAGKDAITYFSELTEAYLGENDFYPIDYIELKQYDPTGFAFTESIWGERTIEPNKHGITFPPTSLKQWLGSHPGGGITESPLDLYYSKYLLTKDGLPVVASRFVDDRAMVQAVYIIDHMVSLVPESVEAMLKDHFRIGIVGFYEKVTDLPEVRMMNEWWPNTDHDARARGYGAIATIPIMTCGEDNIIEGMPDRHWTESIMVHEFAHNVDHGLHRGQKGWRKKIHDTYQNAKDNGLWIDSYCGSNPLEYFAVGVQAWFDTAYAHDIKGYDGILITREQLKVCYSIELYNLIATVMPKGKLYGYHFPNT